ncbi:MAG TPA: hypothetical protein VFK58_05180 [Sphingomicrobium sp.]|nr:hypothetical protein [Sphingomicrobium sp.]
MNRLEKLALIGGGAAILLALGAARRPALFAGIERGLWEVTGVPGSAPQRLCLAEPLVLAQFEHRLETCERDIVRDTRSVAEIHYRCSSRGFGRSTITALTPRSVRIETQGISGGVPFNYLLQARRVGGC